MPVAPNTTVPVAGAKTEAVPLQAVVLTEFSFSVAASPFKVPAVRVTFPVKVWLKDAAPRSSVPPVPLIVSAPPVKLPVSVAVPPVFDMSTVPEVVKPPILCGAVPARVSPPVPPVVAPELTRLPVKVSNPLDVNDAPELRVKLIPVEVKTRALLKVIPVPLITTPPPSVFAA